MGKAVGKAVGKARAKPSANQRDEQWELKGVQL